MTTSQDVHAACEDLAQGLEAFAADASRLDQLKRCLGALAWLREQYQADADPFAAHLPRVKELSQQMRQALHDKRQALTARYVEANAAVAAWQDTRDTLRGALLELIEADQTERLDSPAGPVFVKRSRSVSLPKPHTPDRQRLLDLIDQAHCWQDVAYPSPARLLKAIDAGRFGPDRADELARLCPAHAITRLTTRPG